MSVGSAASNEQAELLEKLDSVRDEVTHTLVAVVTSEGCALEARDRLRLRSALAFAAEALEDAADWLRKEPTLVADRPQEKRDERVMALTSCLRIVQGAVATALDQVSS